MQTVPWPRELYGASERQSFEESDTPRRWEIFRVYSAMQDAAQTRQIVLEMGGEERREEQHHTSLQNK
jgi:hypothetical protein